MPHILIWYSSWASQSLLGSVEMQYADDCDTNQLESGSFSTYFVGFVAQFQSHSDDHDEYFAPEMHALSPMLQMDWSIFSINFNKNRIFLKLTLCIIIPSSTQVTANLLLCQMTMEIHQQHRWCCDRYQKWLQLIQRCKWYRLHQCIRITKLNKIAILKYQHLIVAN